MSEVGIFEWPVPNGVRMRIPQIIDKEEYLSINAIDNEKEKNIGRGE